VLVWGEQDRMYPPVHAERFRELLTSDDVESVTVPDAGHMVPYEQPERVLGAVRPVLV